MSKWGGKKETILNQNITIKDALTNCAINK